MNYARRYGVPHFTDVDQIPDDVDAACVVIRSGLLGGEGTAIAQRLMARGIHVLQEHPLHHDELAACLRKSRESLSVYQLNSFYVQLAPVRGFIAAARELLSRHQPVFADAVCGFQVGYALFDILGQVLGGVRPWAFSALPAGGDTAVGHLSGQSSTAGPFRSVAGTLAGVPFTLRIQNQLDPADPDNCAHLFQRVTIGTDAGQLTLVGTHGPVVWAARPRLPGRARASGDGLPSSVVLGPAEVPGWPELFSTVWPAGAGRAMRCLRDAIVSGHDPLRQGQYHLALCLLWQDLAACVGPPELISCAEPGVLSADGLAALIAAGERGEGGGSR
jgi:thiazolinyl imide reductase